MRKNAACLVGRRLVRGRMSFGKLLWRLLTNMAFVLTHRAALSCAVAGSCKVINREEQVLSHNTFPQTDTEGSNCSNSDEPLLPASRQSNLGELCLAFATTHRIVTDTLC